MGHEAPPNETAEVRRELILKLTDTSLTEAEIGRLKAKLRLLREQE